MDKFLETIKTGYSFGGETITMGAGVWNGVVHKEAQVKLPLKTLNRHGLVAGATGTGKTKTLQRLAEALSEKGVPVLIMDIKGDVSGISQPGENNPKLAERAEKCGLEWSPEKYPVEFLTLAGGDGAKVRATVSEFGPIVMARMLELNETQQGILALIFKFADDYKLPLLDIKDLKKLISFLTNEGKSLLSGDYGTISTTSTGIILRKLVELEGQGANEFFGEPSFEVADLTRRTSEGKGVISVLRLVNMQSRPKLFSSFMLALLAEIYNTYPEEGDLDKPKLVMMVDEAHLLFKEATSSLMSEMETTIKLIRSKGVGIIFCTQLPTDVPPVILSQLGLKCQFALRAFTAMDRKAIKLTAQNYPETEFYDTAELITALGIGEALVTGLSEKGNPTPLVHTMMAPPRSRMDTISSDELKVAVASSQLSGKYAQAVDGESAYEILTRKLSGNAAVSEDSRSKTQDSIMPNTGGDALGGLLAGVFGAGIGASIMKAATSTVINNVTGRLVRGVLGGIIKR